MPVFRLSKPMVFPPPEMAESDGLLAVGGDLSSERLLRAYRMGIFPWYGDDSPILWWSPDPRMVFFPAQWKPSRSLERLVKKGAFDVSMDTAFAAVIEACANARGPGRDSTWITPEMMAAYIRLHKEGYAHSVECCIDGQLVGGLYGVSIGGCFFGESMFSNVSNASKVALAVLMKYLAARGFTLVDCQVKNDHLVRLGAQEIPRTEFLARLGEALEMETRRGKWEPDTRVQT
ncbi:MAG: leucyl/phenylalanyl-tRNA--protein transferase [Candidatus Hydrogenedentes bacterium]|nr:leucyl/phenylalanyl-tRNA--protein transferase [Candidatus Hydrogenedentota bacterium]